MLRNLHLTTAYGGASPQGEALERFASKPYASQYQEKIHVGQGLAPAEKDGTSKIVLYKLWHVEQIVYPL